MQSLKTGKQPLKVLYALLVLFRSNKLFYQKIPHTKTSFQISIEENF